MVPAVGLEFAGQQPQQRGLAAAVGADEADAHAVGDEEVQVLRRSSFGLAEAQGDVLELDQALGLAIGGGEVDAGGRGLDALVDVAELADEVLGVVDAGLGLGGAGLGAAAEPVDFDLDAVLEGVLQLRLRLEVGLPALDELRVAALYAQQAFGVDAG